jgi:hypothetical protein
MKRMTLLVVSVLLAAPAAAVAKGGVEFDTDVERVAVGHRIGFTLILTGDAQPGKPSTALAGVRALVIFGDRSTGRRLFVRAGRSDSMGIARGSVRFPTKGPWGTRITARGKTLFAFAETRTDRLGDGAFSTGTNVGQPPIGVPLPPDPPKAATGFPWVWVLSAASILAAVSLAAARAGRLRGRLIRTLFGGGA